MSRPNNQHTSFHYAWIIVATGTLVISACLGFGRFALGMLLPSMASSLALTYSQIGFISTGNFIGYLIAVLLCSPVAKQIGSRRLIVSALAVIAISMLSISRAHSFGIVLLLYFFTGMGSGAANVPMMGLITAWFDRTIRGRAAGFVVIGSGFAIILSGLLIPAVNLSVGPEGWRTSWMLLSGIVAVIAVIAVLLLRNLPQDKGLVALGSEDVPDQGIGGKSSQKHRVSIYRNKSVYLLGVIYFLFGYTYVIYATFIVTTLVRERGFSETVAGTFWSWVGFLSLFSGPIFGSLSDRLGRKTGLMIVFLLQTLAYLLVALPLPSLFLYLSIFFYGIVAWSIPSIMVAAVSEYVGAERALAAFGFITFIFGLGQISGPSVAGMLAERSGAFTSSYAMAALFAAFAIVLTALLRRPVD
ncbi:MAG: YbfB/YjiJ family MFS transporter [Nitrospiraceae bacterium]|nr:YbfB/YjiJ family MFS transporter [Nitrospiraceae bacterium]